MSENNDFSKAREDRLDDKHDDYSGESGRRADPEKVVETIRRRLAREGVDVDAQSDAGAHHNLSWDNPEHRDHVRSQFAENGELSAEGMLPGFGPDGEGENARDDCGEAHPFVCPGCGNSVEFGRTCGQSVCARCGVAWCRDSAMAKSAKLRRVRMEKHKGTDGSEHQKFHHQIISPPLKWWADLARAGYSLEEAQDITEDVVKSILEEMRAQGLLIHHSFRGEQDDGSLARDDEVAPIDEDGLAYDQDDQGFWKEVLNSDLPFYGDDGVRGELAWNPHWHCVVVADWLRGEGFTDYVEHYTGWVIHRITGEDGKSVRNDGQMAKVVTYSISHLRINAHDDRPNQSAASWVGSALGDIIKSSSRFAAKPSDKEWADGVVRRVSWEVLGLNSSSTECGSDLPPVSDPDELAVRVLQALYPDEPVRDQVERGERDRDVVLEHMAAGDIKVDVSTHSGGGGSVTVRSAFGLDVSGGWDGSNLPSPGGKGGSSDAPIRSLQEDADDDDDCDCDSCTETMVPLGVARQQGWIDDDEWAADAPHSDEARAADSEWSEDLEPWRTTSPGRAIGA